MFAEEISKATEDKPECSIKSMASLELITGVRSWAPDLLSASQASLRAALGALCHAGGVAHGLKIGIGLFLK